MFSRGSKATGRHARGDRSRRASGGGDPAESQPGRPGVAQTGREAGRSRAGRSLADELDVAGELSPVERSAPAEPAPVPAGPYDISEAPSGVTRLDLGSLKIPSVPGVEVRVQANQQGAVQQVFLVHGDSALQLGVFAAPRTESIWDEVRGEIRKSLFADGVAAEEEPGEYGIELRARVRTQQGLKDLRFVGVSGPRWLVRAVYNGPAAVDPSRATALTECLRGLVVDRGDEAKPVKEPLPLRLSEQMAAQLPGTSPDAPATSAQAQPPGQASAPVNGSTPAAVPPPPPRRKPSPRPRRQG
jgi:hypothetical protein